MALAITAAPQVFGLPQQLVRERRRRVRRGTGKRFASKAVRNRNERLERPGHWQLSHAIRRFTTPRSVARAAAIREDFDDSAVDATTWFATDDFDLEAYKAHEQHKQVQRAIRANRRQLRLQDREVVLEYHEVFAEQDRAMSAQLSQLEAEMRRERASVPDIHGRIRELKQRIQFLESRKRLSRKKRAELCEAHVELCEMQTLLIAA